MVEVNIRDDVKNINEIEKIVYARVRKEGKELLVEVLKGMEKEALRGIKGVKVGFEEMRMHSYEFGE